jgi:hypothetical protein
VAEVPGVVYRDNLIDSGNNIAQCAIADIFQTTFAPCFDSPDLTYNGFVITFPGSDPLFKFTHASNDYVANWAAVQFVGSDPDVVTDWALQPTSPFYQNASDSTDRGCNIPELLAQLAFNDGFGEAPTSTRVSLLGALTVSGGVIIN